MNDKLLFDAIDAMYSLAADPEQEMDNVDRSSAVELLRELADRLESGENAPSTIAFAHDVFLIR